MLRLGRAARRLGHELQGLSRSVATTSAAIGGRKQPPPSPGANAKKNASALTMRPRAGTVEAKPVHTPKQPKHGRLTRKARSPQPKKWVRPGPRREYARTANRAARRRRYLSEAFNDPDARVPHFRLGFHVLHHSRPLRRGRRGRLATWLRRKLLEKNELQTRRNRKRMGRPEISLDRPRRWNRPLPEGILPAYDEALKVIRMDARRVRAEAEKKRKEVLRMHKMLSGALPGAAPVEGEEKRALEGELEKMREKLEILDVQSEVNLPEVRWSVANAMADMTIPSHRHLVEQRWRKDGALDLLMERIHQMNVIPDVLPVLHPSVDLHIAARLMPEHFDTLMRRNRLQRRVNTFKDVVPGNYLTPQQTRVPPKLYANVFHTDVRLYTMLLVDPDVPDEENQTFTTFLHWLKPNIPLSATHTGRIPLLNSHTRYIPPHPQRGTPYHRYVLLLLQQPPLPGHRYTRNTEALLTDQQARLSQSLRDGALLSADLASEVEKAVAAARVFGKTGKEVNNVTDVGKVNGRSAANRTRTGAVSHPTHPNAALPHPTSGGDPLAGVVTLSQVVDVDPVPESDRLGFDVRGFAKQFGLNGALGGGVHMWREVWDKYVGAVYRYDLHKPQPVYGRPPKYDPQREAHSAPTRRKYRIDA